MESPFKDVSSQLVGAALAVVISALIVTACSGGDESATRATGSSASAPATDHVVREYPGGGPVDRVFPPDDHAYEILAAGSCDELLQKTEQWGDAVIAQVGKDTALVYASAAHACLGQWDAAKALLAQVDAGNPTFSGEVSEATAEQLCARTAVLHWVTELVHEREADPSFTPQFVRASAQQPCAPPSTSSSSTTSSTSSMSTSTTTGPATSTTTR